MCEFIIAEKILHDLINVKESKHISTKAIFELAKLFESKIAFNSRYLQDALAVLERGKVVMETTTPSAPGVFKPIDSDDYIHVVMPMFVQW